MYLALARKYRPQYFKDLIGQPHVTKTLQNAIEMNKLYPALIFSGMKGVGKTSTARILAKALNCEKGPASEPCNECQICQEITEDKSPDYIEIDGASNNGVEEVRNLREKVRYKPLRNPYRVVVIDEVHMLSTSAWNALLKTVEEPPEHTYFIMATTGFHKIPATIVSRCQHFEFKRISYEIIITVLKEISKKEKIKISDYALYLISRSSEGSLRDAKKILDQAVALGNKDVKDNDVIDILGIIEEKIFIDLTGNILNQNRNEIIRQMNVLSERGIDLRFFYNEYLKFLMDLIVIKSLKESKDFININPENIQEIKNILKDVQEVELLRYFNATKDLELTIRNTENPRIILEYLFIKLSYFPSLVPIEEVIDKLVSPNSPAEKLKIRESTLDVEETVAEIPKSPEKSETAFLKEIEKENPKLALAMQSASISIDKNILNIEFLSQFEPDFKLVKDQVDYLEKKLIELKGKSMEVKVMLKMKKNKVSENNTITDIKRDKKINSLLSKIKGRVISIENLNGGENG